MNEAFASVCSFLSEKKIRFALLDDSPKEFRLLVSGVSARELKKGFSTLGFKFLCDFEKEKYLYGMDKFLRFFNGEIYVTICFQIACRSTLHGEWVPLDRKINSTALQTIREEGEIPTLSPEDALCYLLAKCVYTEKNFSKEDCEKISENFEIADREKLFFKLEGVFFRFTETMIKMCEEKNFSEIIVSLWEFSDY